LGFALLACTWGSSLFVPSFALLLGVLLNGACPSFINIYYFPIEPISLAVQISKLSHMLQLWMLGLGEPGCIWYHDKKEAPSFFFFGGGFLLDIRLIA
jgi:hypothetical protein